MFKVGLCFCHRNGNKFFYEKNLLISIFMFLFFKSATTLLRKAVPDPSLKNNSIIQAQDETPFQHHFPLQPRTTDDTLDTPITLVQRQSLFRIPLDTLPHIPPQPTTRQLLLLSENESPYVRSRKGRSSVVSTSNEAKDLPVHKRTSVQYSSLVGPSFVNMTYHSHVRALAGQTAVLVCIIKNLHNYTVSWVRAQDISLLTANLNTYSSDTRFVSNNPASGSRWQLKIHHVKLKDEGTYLCQVSTTPPITTPVSLTVTKANVSVEPGREVYVKVGSPVLLTCSVTGCPAPVLPMWYKGDKLLEGTTVKETPFGVLTEDKDTTSDNRGETDDTEPVDELLLHQRWKETSVVFERSAAAVSHSGLYTCTNTCTPPVNVTLHVLLSDEETAAMQHINTCSSVSSQVLVLTILLLCTLLRQCCPYCC